MEDLRHAVAGADFSIFDAMRPIKFHDLTEHERMVFAEISNFSCQMPEAAAQLCRTVEHLHARRIEGAFVECGVFLGASIIVMMRTLNRIGATDRDVWLFDTFEGMPEPEAVDQFYCEAPGDNMKFWDKTKRGDGGSDWVRGEVDRVRANIEPCGYPKERVHYVKGMVEDTIPENAPDKIALLRLDTDFYASTRHELEHLYPRVVSGGVVIIDDYGAYKGSRKATDEYLQDLDTPILLMRIDEHVRMFVKP